jgi:RNase P subunit RPR2
MVSLLHPDTRVKETQMAKKTCAACDCPLEPNSTIKVKIAGKTVEVCCEECSTRLKEAAAKPKKSA